MTDYTVSLNATTTSFSLVNTLGGNKLQANKEYNLNFTVATASITMKFGANNSNSSAPGSYFNSDTVYATGTHNYTFTPSNNFSYL